MKAQSWEQELADKRQELASMLPSYASKGGADRVVLRFALAILAGEVALRNGVFSKQYVDETDLFNGVLVCVLRWVTTRWNHLFVLADVLTSQSAYRSPRQIRFAVVSP